MSERFNAAGVSPAGAANYDPPVDLNAADRDMPIETLPATEGRRQTRGRPEVLILKPSSLGDVVQALPILDPLKRAYPDARVTWFVFAESAPLVRGHPALDRMWSVPHPRVGRAVRQPALTAAFARFARILRDERFDIVVDLQGLLRSAVVTWLTGAPVRIGFADAREGAVAAYTMWVREPHRQRHLIQRYLDPLRALLRHQGRAREADEVTPGDFGVTCDEDERANVQALLATRGVGRDRPYVTLAGFDRRGTKSLPPTRNAELASRLVEVADVDVVLTGAPAEADAVEAMRQAVRAPARERVVNLAGRTSVRGLIALLAGALAHVGADSAPMHLACALGRPVLAIFGPTEPTRYGPYAARDVVVRGTCREGIMPCYRHRCDHLSCMHSLDLSALVDAVVRVRTVGEAGSTAPGSGETISEMSLR